jgi:nitroreductase
MDFLDIVKGRRSIRRYLEREVPAELLEQVLEAVRWAPSGGNLQPWEVVVVTDPDTKRRIQETLGEGNPARRAVVEAPLLLVLCGKVKIPEAYRREASTKFGNNWFLCHLGIAAQNLCLAAHGLGLGTVMVGSFDHDQAARILQVPPGYEAVLLIPLGYPAKVSEAPARRTVQEFRHDGSFGTHSKGK